MSHHSTPPLGFFSKAVGDKQPGREQRLLPGRVQQLRPQEPDLRADQQVIQ